MKQKLAKLFALVFFVNVLIFNQVEARRFKNRKNLKKILNNQSKKLNSLIGLFNSLMASTSQHLQQSGGNHCQAHLNLKLQTRLYPSKA